MTMHLLGPAYTTTRTSKRKLVPVSVTSKFKYVLIFLFVVYLIF